MSVLTDVLVGNESQTENAWRKEAEEKKGNKTSRKGLTTEALTELC